LQRVLGYFTLCTLRESTVLIVLHVHFGSGRRESSSSILDVACYLYDVSAVEAVHAVYAKDAVLRRYDAIPVRGQKVPALL
jgi:hypothetical protein